MTSFRRSEPNQRIGLKARAAVVCLFLVSACGSTGRLELISHRARDAGTTSVPDEPEASAPEAPSRECGNNADCMMPQPTCETTSGTCVQCLSNPDCREIEGDMLCDPLSMRCVECIMDADCEGDDACDPIGRRCADPCSQDADCSSGERAQCATGRGVCVECTAHSDCNEEDSICDSNAGRCVACLSDADCPDGLACDRAESECR